MDCEICYTTFTEENEPKVLKCCGHTFCEPCVIKLWKDSKIICPICWKM